MHQMKVVNIVENLADWLKLLRKYGIKRTDCTDYVEMYHDFMALRAAPNSKHREVLRDLEAKYGYGKTKIWELVAKLDKEI